MFMINILCVRILSHVLSCESTLLGAECVDGSIFNALTFSRKYHADGQFTFLPVFNRTGSQGLLTFFFENLLST